MITVLNFKPLDVTHFKQEFFLNSSIFREKYGSLRNIFSIAVHALEMAAEIGQIVKVLTPIEANTTTTSSI